jgi:TatD DNase family protein
MIDFHTHLDLYPNALAILPKVNEINMFTLSVTTSPRAWIATTKVFSQYSNIKVALGLHPEIVEKKKNESNILLESISKAKFIGEIGIDGSSRFSNSVSLQESIFESTIKECERVGGRIISVHSRGAASKVLSILERYPSAGTIILHWFSGSLKDLEKAVTMNCWFSVGPIMSNSKNGQLLMNRMPKDRILPESDGPFASKNNHPIMPWEAITITNKLGELWKMSFNEAQKQILDNFKGFLMTNNVNMNLTLLSDT